MLIQLKTFHRGYRIPMAPPPLTGGLCPQGTKEGDSMSVEIKVGRQV